MSLSDAMTKALLGYADKLEKLIRSIEAAKQRLESLNGQQVGQAELYEVIEILEGQQ